MAIEVMRHEAEVGANSRGGGIRGRRLRVGHHCCGYSGPFLKKALIPEQLSQVMFRSQGWVMV